MTSPTIARPSRSEYDRYYDGYISRVPEGDLFDLLERQGRETQGLLRGIDDAKALTRYAPGKWSIKDMLGHVIDTERIYAYRALRFARGDAQPLSGFEQDDYVRAAGSDRRPLVELAAELDQVRRATILLFRSFDGAALERRGTADTKALTVRALAYIIAGHERHHVAILRERYL